ncbi:hypothetical protein POPTR_001G182150v4 [Populus trichocarpa]|uniref:Uncharacterized protein n=1 Tax=Populus trichocarpa TaxID=3694 RepID=A0ACC0TKX7_POPTR|nr:hypothetical protein POPTR_001G182150v4 [Populus trichocarpa]
MVFGYAGAAAFQHFPKLFLHAFHISLTTETFPVTTVNYSPRNLTIFFLVSVADQCIIDELKPQFPSPNCSPLSSLATTPFLFCPKTTNPGASFFPSVHSFQTKIENTNLHRSVPPLLQLQKTPKKFVLEKVHDRDTKQSCNTVVVCRTKTETEDKAAEPCWFGHLKR